jgi:hypothetical protein
MLRPWSAESRLLASDDCAATRDPRYDGPAFGTNCREAFSGRAAALWGSGSGRIRKFGRQLVSLQSPRHEPGVRSAAVDRWPMHLAHQRFEELVGRLGNELPPARDGQVLTRSGIPIPSLYPLGAGPAHSRRIPNVHKRRWGPLRCPSLRVSLPRAGGHRC